MTKLEYRQREEALRRLSMLVERYELDPSLVEEFRAGRPYYSFGDGGWTAPIASDPLLCARLCRDFQARTGALVYYGILSVVEWRWHLTLLYVSRRPAQWRDEWEDALAAEWYESGWIKEPCEVELTARDGVLYRDDFECPLSILPSTLTLEDPGLIPDEEPDWADLGKRVAAFLDGWGMDGEVLWPGEPDPNFAFEELAPDGPEREQFPVLRLLRSQGKDPRPALSIFCGSSLWAFLGYDGGEDEDGEKDYGTPCLRWDELSDEVKLTLIEETDWFDDDLFYFGDYYDPNRCTLRGLPNSILDPLEFDSYEEYLAAEDPWLHDDPAQVERDMLAEADRLILTEYGPQIYEPGVEGIFQKEFQALLAPYRLSRTTRGRKVLYFHL